MKDYLGLKIHLNDEVIVHYNAKLFTGVVDEFYYDNNKVRVYIKEKNTYVYKNPSFLINKETILNALIVHCPEDLI